MSSDLINSEPQTWPALSSHILNKVGFLGFLLGLFILLIIFCGDDDQKSQLVSAIYFQHENIAYSIVFYSFILAIVLNYMIVKHRNKNKTTAALLIQEQQLRAKDVRINKLIKELKSCDPDNQMLETD